MKDLDFSYETLRERDDKERKHALIYAEAVLRKLKEEYQADYDDTLFTIPETQEGLDDRNFELYGLQNTINLLDRAIREIEQIV